MEKALINKFIYRKDIDGLRAIAVLLVIFYHLSPSVFIHGYIGVDIFFVISGFVVTQSFEKNIRSSYYQTLMNFYSRRAKRILPPLYFMILITFVLACFFIPNTELSSIYKTALSGIFGLSNLALLIARFDYFSPDLQSNPFVHTWSLGVEEQFYLLFPSLLIFLSFTKTYFEWISTKGILLIILLISFLLWIFLQYEAPLVGFYNPFARFWELLVGSLLYLNKEKISKINNIFPSVYYALAAIMFLTIFLDLSSFKAFIFLPTIFAILGVSSLIIVGTNQQENRIFLTNKGLNFIGKISYSLYLWHYSVFALMHWSIGLDSSINIIIALTLTFLLSYFSYIFIEKPFRYTKKGYTKVLYTGVLSGIALAVIVLFLNFLPSSRIYLGNGDQYVGLWVPEDSPMNPSLRVNQRSCHLEYLDQFSEGLFDKCSTSKGYKNKIFLFGNSHTQHLIPMIDVVSNKLGYDYSSTTISSARMIDATQLITSINYKFTLAKEYFSKLSNYILRNARKGDIVLVGHRSLIERPEESNKHFISNIYVEGERISNEKAYQLSIHNLTSFAKKLDSINVDLIFVGATPNFKISSPQGAPEWFRTTRGESTIPIDSVIKMSFPANQAIDEVLSKTRNTYFFNPLRSLCGQKYCHQTYEGNLLYRDKHHFSIYGSQFLSNDFINFINEMK